MSSFNRVKQLAAEQQSSSSSPIVPQTLSAYDRDIVTRTLLGEAANEGDKGQAAVAHVIRNRTLSGRYPDTPAKVALQRAAGSKYGQFSAWNPKSATGNDLVRKYNPGSPQYDRAAAIVDRVFAGEIPDATGGATHYYAPAGMPGGRAPRWWKSEVAKAGGVIRIGGHKFAGNPSRAGSFTPANIAQTTSSEANNVKISTTPEVDIYDPTPQTQRPDSNLLSIFMDDADRSRAERVNFLSRGFRNA